MQEGDLSPKVTPLLKFLPSRVTSSGDTLGELTEGFAFVFANVSVEQESPPTFYFILRKGLKSTAKTFEIFLGFGE